MARIFFYICDYFGSIEKCNVQRNTIRIRKQATRPKNIPSCITTEPLQLVDLLLNLRFFHRYRLKVANALANYGVPSKTLVVKLVPPAKEHLDYHWGERAVRMIWELVEITELMAWLSTLGGAFSALGNYQPACADTAGKISLHQMELAFRLGDPSLVARCKLYLAISLVQREQFAAAGHIVRHVYRHERKQTVPDTRLLKMCQGIWSKLRYEYDIYRRNVARKKT
ncbi:uncharacterized protein F58A4.6 [Anopheles maculipalpis]|uniref:uncharacterized protein F58A4.6 n=1 Tax=Anopheles maculipalpis TaxID=1496333 RepID=UPI0021590FA5|nr:uncharacterized protein F58A4.6 [Anopheles maculipalpis]